ncbi:PAS domain-containing protein [Mariprofundus ferrinatatus]|uniref:PAS domain-containing protein n=1 Tax=Mariprofundus ferrinatatus TaxID=1921087 RepID=A0A2K8LEP8_9PROT|nr:GAF domain-containing protein [Mariprofundus ferrinatatus]ATX82746.1 PAS domain-containing protein [Mariprofundus ferrinatatus]
MSYPSKPEVPDFLRSKWQKLTDILAKSSGFPAALIMRVIPPEIEVFVSSNSAGNPYESGERASLDTGLYCETVMATHEQLHVPDAMKSPEWDHNPDIKLGMVCYLGLPIEWPDGEPFGTVCILDRKDNPKARDNVELMELLKEIIELDLRHLAETERARREDSLGHILDKLKYLAYFNASPYAILVYDMSGYVDCNPAALKLLQLSNKSELIGTNPSDFMPELQPDGNRSVDVIETAKKQAIAEGRFSEEMSFLTRRHVEFVARLDLLWVSVMNFNLLLFIIHRVDR